MTMILDGTGGVTFPAGGVGNPAGAVVGTTDTQTLTNKTLTAPTLASANITTALTLTGASGTNGQALTSGGSGNAPTWTTIGASTATPTALGTVYGSTLSTGASTTALGYQAFNASSTGTLNTAVGWQALTANTSGNNNTAVGEGALTANTTGSENVAVGLRSLYDNQTGSFNTACGRNAFRVHTGNNGVAVGYEALSSCTASGNTAVGYQAGTTITNGSQDCYIGTGSNASSASVNFEIVVGVNSSVGKGGSTGYINPNGGGVYQGNNSSSWSTTSDRRLKKNITDNTEGLDKVVQIRVRNFEYRTAEEVTELPEHTVVNKEGVQLGVIAQELQEICPDCIKTETTGVISVDSDNIFWHMVNAIKDLKALNDTQTETINALTARIVALESA